MPYSYDRRSASDDKAQEHLEDVRSRCGEAAEEAERVHNELDRRTDSGALSDPSKLSDGIYENLRIAEGDARNLQDVVACITDAKADLVKLGSPESREERGEVRQR